MITTQVNISTPRSAELFTYDQDWREVAALVRDLLTIEVFPYWPREQIRLSWASSDARTDAVLWGMAFAWQLPGYEEAATDGGPE